jgi:hypothetical protein
MKNNLAIASITLNIAEAYAAREALYIMGEQAKEQHQDRVWSILTIISMRFNEMFTEDEWDEYHRQMSEWLERENDTEGKE